MATVTKTFSFAASAEGFVATAGANSALTWDSTTGNPAGALKARITGRSKSNANYWAWSGTWESLGVPTGATVTNVRVNAAYTRCTEYTTGASSTIGPYELRDGSAVLQATLWAGRTVSGTDGAWVAVAAQADQAVPSAIQASGSTVQLRLADTLATGASSSAAVSTYDDEVSFVITYTPPVVTVNGNQATETDTANAGTPRVTVNGAQATETDAALVGATLVARTVAGSQAAETDTALAGTARVTVAGRQATETDSALAGSSVTGIIVLGAQATETDSGFVGSPVVTVAGRQSSETDAGLVGAAAVTVAGVLASETSTALAGTAAVTVSGTQAVETDTANAGTPTQGAPVVPDAPGHSSATHAATFGRTTTHAAVGGSSTSETAAGSSTAGES